MPERDEAIEKAKSLQSNWKAAGSLWRSKEQELWTQFREHLDPLFSELKEQQASIKAADDERLSAQKNLNTELASILKSEGDLAVLHGKVLGLQDGWKDIEHPDRRLLIMDSIATLSSSTGFIFNLISVNFFSVFNISVPEAFSSKPFTRFLAT